MQDLKKHSTLVKAWLDGAEIEVFNYANKSWECANSPTWYANLEYRIKKNIVKKWRWAIQSKSNLDNMWVTSGYYTDYCDVAYKHPDLNPLQKIDCTMIEVEE